MGHSNQNLYQPLLNQAHLCVGEKKFELSINLYEKVLEKHLPGDLKTQMYLSKALYRKGDFEGSKNLTLQLIAKHPQSISLRFNLALCLYNQADKIFNQEVRRVYQTKEAISYLQQSLKLFYWIQRQIKPLFSYHRSVDLGQEQRDNLAEQYNQWLQISETKIQVLEEMLQTSQIKQLKIQ